MAKRKLINFIFVFFLICSSPTFANPNLDQWLDTEKTYKDLIDEGAFLSIHDPKVSENQILNDLGSYPLPQNQKSRNSNYEKGSWKYIKDINESFFEADAIVILTEWAEYKKINWDLAERRMRKPAWIFDSRSLIDPSDIKNNSFNFWRIGDGS